MMARRIGAVALALFATACPEDTGLRSGCRLDTDCLPGFSCDAETATCRCKADTSCAASEFCNAAGFCQRRVGCDSNRDCPPDQFCDTTTGNCLDNGRCLSDLHCPSGQVCDRRTFRCAIGCRATSDCSLGLVCRCAGTTDSPGDDTCSLGQCVGGPCDDATFCPYGYNCESPAAGEDKVCAKDERGPFCEMCRTSAGDPEWCPGEGPNYCLVDRKVAYRGSFCGVDCSEGQPCPHGYGCRNILILTSAICYADADCPARGEACDGDEDCAGARCDRAAGRCAGKCSLGEDNVKGFCTCVADSECPRDFCDATTRRCSLTRKPCTLGGSECGRAIYCVNLGDRNACLIGKNCAPDEGLSCSAIRAQE